jgi:hypothetical protein
MFRDRETMFLGRIAGILHRVLFSSSPSANLVGVDEENHKE